MGAIMRILMISLKYAVNIGPLLYEATSWGIKIVREFRFKKTVPPVTETTPEKPTIPPNGKVDPG